MKKPALEVAVVGAGIGGLAAANALMRRNIKVTLYEQAPELGEVGAGVLLTPNSVRLLNRLGIGDAVRKLGAYIDSTSQYLRHDGTPVAPYMTSDSTGWNAVYGLHRADLLNILLDRLPPDAVRTGRRCTGVQQDDASVSLTFEDGSHAKADVAIGADGIHSVLQSFVGTSSQPRFSGSAAYRGLIDSELVPTVPKTLSLWMGEKRHFLVYPVRAGKLLNYVAFVPSSAARTESWSAPGDRATLAKEFEGWDPRIGSLIERVDSTFQWGLYDRDPLPTWTCGRLALLGDAAHAMLPHMGQGANQSLEDAFALATALQHADNETAPDALQTYETARRARTTAVQVGSRENGLRYDSIYEDLAIRDAEIASSERFRLWLFDYDAEREVEGATTPSDSTKASAAQPVRQQSEERS